MKLQAVEIESDYLDGKMFMRVQTANSEMLVPYVENHENYDKWLKWFEEEQLFDTYK